MKVLLSPAQTFLSPSYGSEVSWAYNIMTRLAENFGIQIYAICGEATDLRLPSNVSLFKVGFSKRELLNGSQFTLRLYNLAKKLAKGANLVHHMFPFGFRSGFNLLAVSGHLREKPFVIGPIQYPQEYSDITDYEWVSGRRGLKARLMYDLEFTAMRIVQKPIETLHEATLSEAEALVFDSRKTLERYRKLYSDILRGKTLRVIPPGVETDQFQYVPSIKGDHFEILTVGYLLKRKGIQYLIRAMPTIVEEFEDVKLRVVGNGPYKENLMRLARELSLSNYLEFSGHMPRHDLPEVYASCDLYVQPSLSETFPSTIREAMAAGRPIVATDVGVIGEYVQDGVNGCLVQPKNHMALARKMIDLLGDEGWRARICEGARKYAEENFNWNKLSEAWYKVYSCVI